MSLVSFNYKWYSECENYIVNYKNATFHYCCYYYHYLLILFSFDQVQTTQIAPFTCPSMETFFFFHCFVFTFPSPASRFNGR